jgi:hypothetical protein
VKLLQAFGHPVELPPQARLAGVVGAVTEPDAERARTELDAELDDVEVVLDGRCADARIGRRHRPELVGQRPAARGRRVVLERVRVHCVEPEPDERRVPAQAGEVLGLVPRYV